MKPTTCYACGGAMEEAESEMEGIKLRCLKCTNCGEELYPASEMFRYEVLTGKRKPVRKITSLGSSIAVRLPKKLVKEVGIHEGDLAYFEKHPEGVLMKVVRAEEK
jgi:hypothetical protein